MGFRTGVGALLIAGIGVLVAIDCFVLLPTRPLCSILLVTLAVLGWGEFARVTGLRGQGPKAERGLDVLGLASVLYFFFVAWAFGDASGRAKSLLLGGGESAWVAGGLFGLIFGAFVVVVFREDYARRYSGLLETIAGVLLLGHLFSYVLRVYHLPGAEGPIACALFVAGVKGNDTAAYYAGKAWGKRRFLSVSPKKTLEGCLGAVAFSTAYFGLMGTLPGPAKSFFPWWGGILLGMILSVVSQLGDLAESLFKRMYQVKDSGAVLPEFGGVLDMIDSLLFTGFVFWAGIQAARPAGS